MILLYANPIEVIYLDYPLRQFIGLSAEYFKPIPKQHYILFGCSGILDGDRKWKNDLCIVSEVYYHGYIYSPDSKIDLPKVKVYHSDCSFHDNPTIIRSFYDANLVDMESGRVISQLEDHSMLTIIRYAIDMCDKKMYPKGINHIWREWQHYKMQKKMNKLLEGRI